VSRFYAKNPVKAIVGLVCSIVGLVTCILGPLFGVVGITCGHIAQSQIKKNPTELKGEGIAMASYIVGYITLVAFIPMLLLAAIAVPNFLRARARSQAATMVHDVRMIESAAEQYAIENGLPSGTTVSFDNLVAAEYFKQGSKLSQGQSGVLLPAGLTFGDVYPSIHPTQKLIVDPRHRQLFDPTVNSSDRILDN